MSRKLKRIFDENIKLDQKEANKYETVLRLVLAELILVMKETSTVFSDLFEEVYFGGSFFDGLKVASTMQEFDINIIFKLASMTSIGIVDLGKDERKPNFANLRMSSWLGFLRSDQAVSVQRPSDGYYYLSPTNLFSLLHDAAETALAQLAGTLHIDGKIYRQGISRLFLYMTILFCRLKKQKVGVPFTIRIECAETAFKCDVDLVPAMKFGLDDLPFFTRHRIQNYNLEFGCEITTFWLSVLLKEERCS